MRIPTSSLQDILHQRGMIDVADWTHIQLGGPTIIYDHDKIKNELISRHLPLTCTWYKECGNFVPLTLFILDQKYYWYFQICTFQTFVFSGGAEPFRSPMVQIT